MRTVISHMGSWAPRPEQTGIAKFLTDDKKVDEYLSNFKTELYKRLRFFYDEFIKLKKDGYRVDAIAPQGALYLTAKFDLFGLKTASGKIIKSSKDINDFLTDEAHVALVPFSSFGSTGDSPWFRLSVGTCTLESAKQVMELMREALSKLK
jgi:aspartate aminotransferase